METVPSPTKITEYIAGPYQAGLHHIGPATDADQLSLWWRGDSNPTNFNGFDDPVLDELLTTGRTSADPPVRTDAYEAVTRRFAEQVYDVWLWHQPWAVATRPGTGSILGPDLPDGSAPLDDLSFPHSLLTATPPS